MSYPCFRELTIHVGNETDALFLFMRLYIELGYQADLHEQAGFFDHGAIDSFNASLDKSKGLHFAQLLAAYVVVPQKDGPDYVCPMFLKSNIELNADSLPEGVRRDILARFNRKRGIATRDGEIMAKRVPEEVWVGKTGYRLTLEEMKRALTLIKVVDSVCAQKSRGRLDFEMGIIHDAHSVNCRFSDVQIDVILKRLYFLRRKKVITLPRYAAEVLRRWDDMLYQILPDEGFIKWDKGVYDPNAKKTT